MIALDRLSVITPLAIALPNKSFATSLQQVAGITNLSLPQFAATVALQQTTVDLPLITAQTQPVSQATINNLLSFLGTGTGPSGTITINDVLGTEAGVTQPQLANAITTINSMNTGYLTTVYQTMVDVINGVYTVVIPPVPPDPDPTSQVDIPSGVPGGPATYSSVDDAIVALIAIANTEVGNLVTTYPTQTTTLNTDFNAIAQQVQNDKANQASAELVFADLSPNDQAIVSSFALSLPQFGVNTVTDGSTQFLYATATTTNLTGQAIVATLRQGSNEAALSSVGIQTTTQIPI